MKVYNIQFEHGLFLAPMSGITDPPMRLLCREYGAELAYTEMISATGLIRAGRNTLKLLDKHKDDKPLIAQIFTAEPNDAALAAKIIEDHGFEGLDINMGCPVKKVVTKGAGSALMKTPETAIKIVEAVLVATKLPISVKMRAGWDSFCLNAESLSKQFADLGVNAIIIHPRTRAEMFRSDPRWSLIPDIKARINVPLIASGNIRSQEDVEKVKSLGADACMIGRAAVGRPWIFRELKGETAPGLSERKEIFSKHIDLSCEYYGEERGIRHVRKFFGGYTKGLHGASHFRQAAGSISDVQKLRKLIDNLG
jgi:nifR3 family TIM-barrel protein